MMTMASTTLPQASEQRSTYPCSTFLIYFFDFFPQWNYPVTHSLATVCKHFFQRTPGRADPRRFDSCLIGLLKDETELVLSFVSSIFRDMPPRWTSHVPGKVVKGYQQPRHHPQRQTLIAKESQSHSLFAQPDKFLGWQMPSTEPAAYQVGMLEIILFAKLFQQTLPRRWIPGLWHQMRKARIRGGGQGANATFGMAESGRDIRRMDAMNEETRPAGRALGPGPSLPVVSPFPGNKSFRGNHFTGGEMNGGTGHIPFSSLSFMYSSLPKTRRFSIVEALPHGNTDTCEAAPT